MSDSNDSFSGRDFQENESRDSDELHDDGEFLEPIAQDKSLFPLTFEKIREAVEFFRTVGIKYY